jgi:hypothetical protein
VSSTGDAVEGLVVGLDDVANDGSTDGCLGVASDGTLLNVIEGLSDFTCSSMEGNANTLNVGIIDLGRVGAMVEGL